MKRNQVNAILIDQTKRRNKIISYLCVIILLTVISLSFLILFINKNKIQYVNYYETSNLNYKVYLKDNDFFKNNYLEENNQYIASLIDYIKANFSYDLVVEEENIDYKYSYKIEANVKVTEKNTKKDLYNYTEILEEEKLTNSNSNSKVNINKEIDIDYNHYNDLIKKFVDIYKLEDIDSVLTVNMYVSVLGNCAKLEDSNTSSVISLSIPLTTKTIDIDMIYDLVDESLEHFMACKTPENCIYTYLIIAILTLGINIFATTLLVKYIIKTRTAESIYEKELKKILNNYKSYIQKINNNFDLEGYQVLKVSTFTDMLEIRDTIEEPILMVENKEKTGVYFLIPSKTKILYSYGLKVSDIKAKIIKEQQNENI